MNKKVSSLLAACLLAATAVLTPTVANSQSTPTTSVPTCKLQFKGVTQYVPCTGVLPVDKDTGNPVAWNEIFSNVNVTSIDGLEVNTGDTSPVAKPVQNTDGSKLATEATTNTLFKAGQSIGNTAFSNVININPIDRGAIVGTTATQLMSANVARKGFSIQVQSNTASCYINSLGTATISYNSLKITPGDYFEPDHQVPNTAISIICTEASVPVYAREW